MTFIFLYKKVGAIKCSKLRDINKTRGFRDVAAIDFDEKLIDDNNNLSIWGNFSLILGIIVKNNW